MNENKIFKFGDYEIENLSKINILLGKNGIGKSRLLKLIDEGLINANNISKEKIGIVKYLSPERGGVLSYDPNIDHNIKSNPINLSQTRRVNQFNKFKEQSVAQFSILELLVLREIEKNKTKRKDLDITFDSVVKKINSLLDRIEIDRADSGFQILQKREKGKPASFSRSEIPPGTISSGESELISLAIEILVFQKQCEADKDNFLLMDEPDVHLHPDLQVKLMTFVRDVVCDDHCRVIIATHSTAILGAFSDFDDVHVKFMKDGDSKLHFSDISEAYKKVLPIFGAHPLSNIFNEAPVLLVEGEDDERIWQQAVRTSQGRIKIYPCACGSKEKVFEFRKDAKKIIDSVYDSGIGYSLVDRDDDPDVDEEDISPFVHLKLSCRIAENLIMTDEVLCFLSTNWETLKNKIDLWLKGNNYHGHLAEMKSFKDSGFDRKDFNVKQIRLDIFGLTESNKSWEVAVGQVIGNLEWTDETDFSKEGSIFNYLGEKLVKSLIPRKN